MTVRRSWKGTNVSPGTYQFDVGDDDMATQIAVKGTAGGTVTINMLVPGEANKGTDYKDTALNIAADAVIGMIAIDDPIMDLTVDNPPRMIYAHADAVVLVATAAFSYHIHNGG